MAARVANQHRPADCYLASRVLVATDPADPTVLDDGAVVVEAPDIAWVGRRADLPAKLASAARRHDLGDCTLMPGLVDAHVHLGFDGGPDPTARMQAETDAEQLVLMLHSARQLLSVGVTTARDLGARAYLDLTVRDAIAAGTARGPRMVTAGSPITVTGGHCWFMGGECDTADDVRRAVRRHHKMGTDLVKVMSTGGFMTRGSAPWYAQFTADQLRAAVDEAHRVGKKVAAHAHGVDGIARAVDAGVDTIEHCSFAHPGGDHAVDRDLVARIAAAGVYVCPTVNLRLPDLLAARGPHVEHPLPALLDAGVPVIAGTDAGIDFTPHHGYVGGLEAMAQLGMPVDDVLHAATGRAARALGVGHLTGRLAPGLEADVIAVDGDPRADLSALHHLRLVLSRGTAFTPDALPSLELDDEARVARQARIAEMAARPAAQQDELAGGAPKT